MGKNLFDYATKELSQDAFILWLFDSWNSDNEIERTTSRKFIQFISGVGENENIQSVWIKPQWYRMDVSCFITMGNREVAIFIEDKVTSSEHNQLQKHMIQSAILSREKKANSKKKTLKGFFIKPIPWMNRKGKGFKKRVGKSLNLIVCVPFGPSSLIWTT